MKSVTCCFLTGLEVLAEVSKQRGAVVELQQEPVPVSAASWGPEAPAARIVLGEGPGQRDTEPLCGGRCCAPCLGCLSGIQGIRLEFLREPFILPGLWLLTYRGDQSPLR